MRKRERHRIGFQGIFKWRADASQFEWCEQTPPELRQRSIHPIGIPHPGKIGKNERKVYWLPGGEVKFGITPIETIDGVGDNHDRELGICTLLGLEGVQEFARQGTHRRA